jgi:hypothetical protein
MELTLIVKRREFLSGNLEVVESHTKLISTLMLRLGFNLMLLRRPSWRIFQ